MNQQIEKCLTMSLLKFILFWHPGRIHLFSGRSPGSNGLKQILFLLPPGSKIYADAGYTNYVIEDLLKDC